MTRLGQTHARHHDLPRRRFPAGARRRTLAVPGLPGNASASQAPPPQKPLGAGIIPRMSLTRRQRRRAATAAIWAVAMVALVAGTGYGVWRYTNRPGTP